MRSPIRAGRKVGCRTPKIRLLGMLPDPPLRIASTEPGAYNRPGWYVLWDDDGLFHRIWDDMQYEAKNISELIELFAPIDEDGFAIYDPLYDEMIVLDDCTLMLVKSNARYRDVEILRRY